MGFKKYLVFGLVLIVVVGLYVYSLIDGYYTLHALDIPIKLPVAVWVILPAVLLYLATVIHLMFYGTLGFFRFRKIKKDAIRFLENQKRALLGKKIENNDYKSEIFKLPGKVLPLLNIDPKRYSDYRVFDDDVADIMEAKQKVYAGEVVDLSRYDLLPDNALVVKNYENMLKNDKSYCATILKKCSDDKLCKKASIAMAEFSPISELEKYDVKITKEILDKLIDRIGSDGFELPNEKIFDIVSELGYGRDDMVELSKKLKDKLSPDERVRFANELVSKYPEIAGEAYLYTMFDLQLIDKARDYLDNSGKDEYVKYKHLLFLKDSGKNFDINMFI